MVKRVIVVASGETERRALPMLVSHLEAQGVFVDEIRIPPRNRALDVRMAERLIKAVWYEKTNARPDKFVLLIDTDGKAPKAVLEPFEQQLPGRLRRIEAPVRYACANQHLEAWYFADAANLRAYLGRAPGHVNTSEPDGIRNPKLHLMHLLDLRAYTARISEEIASKLDARVIAQRSPSFRGFLDAAMNGPRPEDE